MVGAMQKELAIIGSGRVGLAIAVLASRCGYRVGALGSRSGAVSLTTNVPVTPYLVAAGRADLILIAVADDAIEAVCADLANHGAFRRGAAVVHLSGCVSSDVLHSAGKLCGCRVGSAHPLQSFPDTQRAIERLPGSYWFCESEQEIPELISLIQALGGRPVQLEKNMKTLYHLAAVFSSGYLVTVFDMALSLAQSAGLDRELAQRALGSLACAAIENAVLLGPQRAFTGPIARADLTTVGRHLEAVQTRDPRIREAYKVLGLQALELARIHSDRSALDAVKALLEKL